MCGIIGILSAESITEALMQSMLQLQHRGRDAAGIFLTDPAFDPPFLEKKSGLVLQLFESIPHLRKARWGLGHIRYTTSGKGKIQDAQPLALKNQLKTLAIAHNGNIVNYSLLKEDLEQEGVVFQTTCDSETILHLIDQHLYRNNPKDREFGKKALENSPAERVTIAREQGASEQANFRGKPTPPKTDSSGCFGIYAQLPFFEQLCLAIETIYKKIQGAYSIIGIMTQEGMFAFRDPNGIRPLLYGRKEGLFAFSSETLPLTQLGCEDIEDVVPGEVLFVDASGTLHKKNIICSHHNHCAFEFNYFAKTPTVLEGQEVYNVRHKLGRMLAEKIQALDLPPIDVVVSIPDTAIVSGIALANELNIPYAEGFIRNDQIGRTFILTGQDKREKAVSQKLYPVRSVFEGKTVLLVDDSIIRGTVSKRVVSMARLAGAKIVIFAVTFPPVAHPCIYGIDFPTKEQLIASRLSVPQICQEIGADALIFNDLDRLKQAIGLQDLCDACITGCYPTSTVGMHTLYSLRG